MDDVTATPAIVLDSLFHPDRVALVGAGSKSMWTAAILRSFRDYGFPGKLFVVNREAKDISGLTGYASCSDIPGGIDTAYIMVPIVAIREAVADVIASGARMAVILTSGFSEVGEAGAALQDEIVAMAEAGGTIIFGPNSLGFVDIHAGRPVTSLQAPLPLLKGAIGLISQSGATANELMECARRYGIKAEQRNLALAQHGDG